MWDSHMTGQHDFVVGQASLHVSSTQSTNSIDEEAVILDGRLESLFTVPCHAGRHAGVSHRSNQGLDRPHFWRTILVLNKQTES
jgi:hypothetical protein